MNLEHLAPRFHVRPPTGWVNDPNGPMWFGDRYHLYFQYTFDTEHRGAVVWGHATSPDLVRWELERPAIAPLPGSIDGDGCWSGNTVEVGGRLLAFYSGFRVGHPYQSVVRAESSDGGRSYGDPRQVVADPPSGEGIRQFRDPFVWRDGAGWAMLVGAGDERAVASARLYRSYDDGLERWRFVGAFAALGRTGLDDPAVGIDTGDMWECPQLVSFGDRDALLVGAYDSTGDSGTMHVLALTGSRSADGDRLEAPRIFRYDEGANFYAPSAMRRSAEGTPIVWGWATEGRTHESAVQDGWCGLLTLPREVRLEPDGRLASFPYAGLTSLRGPAIGPRTKGIRAYVFDNVPAGFELRLDLEPDPQTAREPVVLTLQSSDREALQVIADRRTGEITVDRSAASSDAAVHAGRFAFVDRDFAVTGRTSLRWFVDGSISEVFTASGHVSTLRFYPTGPPPWRLSLTGTTGAAQLWPLRDALSYLRPLGTGV